MKYCHKCGVEWNGINQPGIRQTCTGCDADMHVCRNCRFFNTHKPYSCEIDIDQPVYDKERANFCEEFQISDNKVAGEKGKKETLDRWNSLFKRDK